MPDKENRLISRAEEKISIFVFAFFSIYAMLYLFHWESGSHRLLPVGSSLRHWPPGTNS
jgi:hypothetical protein